jgi:hypothetical protein
MFFENTTDIYSYGRHYLAARMHVAKGKRFALVRSDAYSTSTGGHLSDIRNALRELVPYFCVAGSAAVQDPKLAVKDLDSRVQGQIDRALTRKFFADSTWCVAENSDRTNHLESIQHALEEANALRAFLGRAPLKMPKTYAAAVAHLDKLLAKFNSPERQKRREDKANARELERVARAKEDAKRTTEQLANFREGKNFGYIAAEYDMLRISSDGRDVQTSGGAEVPLVKACALFAAIEAGERDSLKGKRISSFTVELFGQDGSTLEEYVKIGCHRILLSEARAVLGKPAQLSLVGGA